jgi:hypothetical protein
MLTFQIRSGRKLKKPKNFSEVVTHPKIDSDEDKRNACKPFTLLVEVWEVPP